MGSFSGMGKLPSELTEETTFAETDIVITGAAKRTTWKNIFEKISFSSLVTTAKNIIGAINELNTNSLKLLTDTHGCGQDFAANGAVKKTYSITFKTAFTEKPFVTAVLQGDASTTYAYHAVAVNNITTTGFDLIVLKSASSTSYTYPVISWGAIGK